MNEKVIVKSEHFDTKKFMLICFVPALVLFLYIVLTAFFTENGRSWCKWGFWDAWVFNFSEGCPGIITVIALFLLVIGGYMYWAYHNTGITVTDKRIYGVAKFGKRVDLPIDSVSSVGVGVFKSISVSSPSGTLVFTMITNRDEVHKAISNLLVNRQNKPTVVTEIKQEIPQSAADELKKYKDLLDNGTISQAEFEAKKKQLLGL